MKERELSAQATLCLSTSNGLLIATPKIPVGTIFWTYNAFVFAEKHDIMRATDEMTGGKHVGVRILRCG